MLQASVNLLRIGNSIDSFAIELKVFGGREILVSVLAILLICIVGLTVSMIIL